MAKKSAGEGNRTERLQILYRNQLWRTTAGRRYDGGSEPTAGGWALQGKPIRTDGRQRDRIRKTVLAHRRRVSPG